MKNGEKKNIDTMEKNELLFLGDVVFDIFVKRIMIMIQRILTGIIIVENIFEYKQVVTYSFDILSALFTDSFLQIITKGSIFMTTYELLGYDSESELTQYIDEIVEIIRSYKGSYSIVELLNLIMMNIMRSCINDIVDIITNLENKTTYER